MERDSYTVGWICALPHELTASRTMFDKTCEPLPNDSAQDKNVYSLGEIAGHGVVMACLPSGSYGTTSAATVATDMLNSFPSIKLGLLVGIGGGVPSEKDDIRLGDVVVSVPDKQHGGVVYYDMGKVLPGGGFEKRGHLDKPPLELLNAINHLRSGYELGLSKLDQYISDVMKEYPGKLQDYKKPQLTTDILYKTECEHQVATGTCTVCSEPVQVARKVRGAEEGPRVHYGLIGSGQKVIASMKDRDYLSANDNILCFEMEAAGLMDNFKCLVIRGISDYADSYKRDGWQRYAALVAAAYAKELLQVVPRKEVAKMVAVPDVKRLDYELGIHLKDAPEVEEDLFVGRQTELEFLATHLLPVQSRSTQKCVVVHGLGGVGKTQLAFRFATRYGSSFSSVFWINANDESTLRQGVIKIAKRSQKSQVTSEDSLHNHEDEAQLVERALEWLSESENSHWLIIFDNHDSPLISNEISESSYAIKAYFPERSHGSILITTRSANVSLGRQLHLEAFRSFDEGLDVLTKRSRRSDLESDSSARKLALRLSGLPLALATAGDYLRHVPISCAEYLENHERLWNELEETAEELSDYGKGRTLYNTWNLSLESIKSQSPEVASLLQFCAYFDNTKIWFELLRGKTSGNSEWHRAIFQSKIKFSAAMRKLQKYSLVEAHYGSDSYSLHTCVHDWMTWHLNEEPNLEMYQLALGCIAALTSTEEEHLYWQKDLLIGPHATRLACQPLFQSLEGRFEFDLAPDVTRIAECLRRLGKFSAADKLYGWLLEGCNEHLGAQNLTTLGALNDAAVSLAAQGKYKEAEAMFRLALAGKIEKSDNVKLLCSSVSNLGNLLQLQERLDEAEFMYKLALKNYEERLGSEDPLTLRISNHLGTLYYEKKDFEKAEELIGKALAGLEKSLGPNHVETLSVSHNLAVLRQSQGKLSSAEEIYSRVLVARETELGMEDKETLETVACLASVHKRQEKLSNAETMYKRAWMGYQQINGTDHLTTINNAELLANLYQRQSKFSEAILMFDQVVEGYRRRVVANKDSIQTDLAKFAEVVQAVFRLHALLVFRYSSSEFLSAVKDSADTWRQALAIELRQRMGGLIYWCRSFWTWTSFFDDLGRMLLRLEDKTNAATALQQKNEEQSDLSIIVSGILCDGCDEGINPISGRFVCESCRDVDLCSRCHENYKLRPSTLQHCSNHEFFKVPYDEEVSKWHNAERQIWLDALVEKLDEAFFADFLRHCWSESSTNS